MSFPPVSDRPEQPAATEGLPLPPTGAGVTCYGGPIGPETIRRFIRGDFPVLIDSPADQPPPDGNDLDGLLHSLPLPGETLLMALSLCTLSAYEHDVSAAITGAMLRQELITAEMLSRLRTALHEAVANALIHGNLELPSPRREEVNDFVTFGEAISARLADPAYAGRRLSVSVCAPADRSAGVHLHIRNEGPGFDPAALPPRERRNPDRAYGGWALILAGCDHAAFSRDGRTLTLTLLPA